MSWCKWWDGKDYFPKKYEAIKFARLEKIYEEVREINLAEYNADREKKQELLLKLKIAFFRFAKVRGESYSDFEVNECLKYSKRRINKYLERYRRKYKNFLERETAEGKLEHVLATQREFEFKECIQVGERDRRNVLFTEEIPGIYFRKCD